MLRLTSAAPLVFIALALAGCQTVGNPFDGFGRSQARPTPLTPAPTKPVTATDLPPPEEVPADAAADGADAAAGEEAKVASLPPATDVKLTHEDLIGGWKITSGGAGCQLFLTLTSWTGGYRATTRGCPEGTLSKISAWDLNGSQVVLKGAEGAEVARLYPTGAERFNGQTTGSAPVSFFR